MTRIALVTGAAGGIGSAAVRVFAAAGWRILAVDRQAFVWVAEGEVSLSADDLEKGKLGRGVRMHRRATL